MAQLTDIAAIRATLRADPAWAVYALGDLSPDLFPQTQWFVPDLALVLKEYGTCILWAAGCGALEEALAHVIWPVHLQVRPDALDVIERHACITRRLRMVRMVLASAGAPTGGPATAWGASSIRVRRLTADDVPALGALYADGDATGEGPDFFMPSMVDTGVFCGVEEHGDLVAVAGTHLVSREEGVAAIGNVYTRRDRRGRGYSTAATRAVLGALAGVEVIGLNVRADNAPALHVYQSLGFVPHVEFYEALATGPR